MNRNIRWIRYSVILLAVGLILLTACSTVQSSLPSAATRSVEYIPYTVQAGDTLSQIAARYRVTLDELIAPNSGQYPSLARDPSTLKAGWQLRVPQPSAQTAPDPPAVDLREAAQLILEGINAERAKKGIPLFRSDVALTHIANDRSVDMVARDYFSHTDPQTGKEPLLRYLQATKFPYHSAGENIAEIKNEAGWLPPWMTVAARYTAFNLADEFVKGWLNSPDHRANIFSANYRRTGIALAVSPDKRRIVATQVFAD